MVETYSLISIRWRKTFSLFVFGIFLFTKFQREQPNRFLLGGKMHVENHRKQYRSVLNISLVASCLHALHPLDQCEESMKVGAQLAHDTPESNWEGLVCEFYKTAKRPRSKIERILHSFRRHSRWIYIQQQSSSSSSNCFYCSIKTIAGRRRTLLLKFVLLFSVAVALQTDDSLQYHKTQIVATGKTVSQQQKWLDHCSAWQRPGVITQQRPDCQEKEKSGWDLEEDGKSVVKPGSIPGWGVGDFFPFLPKLCFQFPSLLSLPFPFPLPSTFCLRLKGTLRIYPK